MEQMAKEERLEEKYDVIATLLESGEITEERIKELYKLTDKQMKAIKERVAVLA